MKRVAAPLVAILLAFALVPAVQAAAKSQFTGSWIGHDPAPPDGDGSTLILNISGGSSPTISFTDLHGTICDNVGAPTALFTSRLSGTVNGDDLDFAFISARCGPVNFGDLGGATGTFEYDPQTDTLFDGFATFERR